MTELIDLEFFPTSTNQVGAAADARRTHGSHEL